MNWRRKGKEGRVRSSGNANANREIGVPGNANLPIGVGRWALPLRRFAAGGSTRSPDAPTLHLNSNHSNWSFSTRLGGLKGVPR
jgi:hypothetical protein